VRLIPPAHVKPYVRCNKSDQVDAAAIYEAMSRPGQRFVPVRSIDNQAALMRHRARELLAGQRTAALNALRGHRAVCDELVDPADRQQAFVEAMELLLLRYARVGRSPRKPGGERSLR
jgi:transposase